MNYYYCNKMTEIECKHNWEIERINMDWKSQVHRCTKCGILRETNYIKNISWKKFQRKLRKILRNHDISKERDKKISSLMMNYYGYGLKYE